MNALVQPRFQRATGSAEVVLEAARPKRLFTTGSAKAILLAAPRPEVVFLNTAGGLTGGDRLTYGLTCDGDTLATTQTAERAYRAPEGRAELSIRLTASRGRLDWLPQETILFQGAALRRHTRIELGADAECLMLEAVVLGRAAMGETVTRVLLDDRREVLRGGRPILVEALRLNDGALAGPATLAGARGFASLALIAQGAGDALTALRPVLDEPGVRAAASAFDGKLTIRMLATDGWPLRRQIARVLDVLRPRSFGPLPRVWQL